MPTIIGHSAVALAICGASNRKISTKILLLALLCGFFPDVDFIGLANGVEYGSLFGHRGFSHSILFAAFFGFIITFGFFPKLKVRSRQFRRLFLLFFLITLSHGLLDMLTNGGYGIALFSPLSNFRFFFSWQPIPVSPIGINNLLDPRTISTLWFELIYLLVPAFAFLTFKYLYKKVGKTS